MPGLNNVKCRNMSNTYIYKAFPITSISGNKNLCNPQEKQSINGRTQQRFFIEGKLEELAKMH